MELVGLKLEAESYIKDNVTDIKDVLVSTPGDEFDLYKYPLKDGTTMHEVVQYINPVNDDVFLCLIDGEGRRLYAWTDKEISNA